jgi:F420-dependent oxidoreductase-like protein
MRISMVLTNYSWPDGAKGLREQLGEVVHEADAGGLDTVWVPDHLIQADPSVPYDAEMLEAYATLGYLAAKTEQVRLGTMVTAVSYRSPAMLIKTVTTLDVLSGGRAWLGIGAGYHGDEARMMGLPLPGTAERFERLTETLQLAKHMFAGDEGPFHGTHYRLDGPVNSPEPVREPPILIGGMGERKTLRLVAEYGDACNLFDVAAAEQVLPGKLDVLARHCSDVGRDYDEIDKTVTTRLHPEEPPEAFAERCAAFDGMGIQHVVLIGNGPWSREEVATLAATVPLVRQL